jgi:hypothetical protein
MPCGSDLGSAASAVVNPRRQSAGRAGGQAANELTSFEFGHDGITE